MTIAAGFLCPDGIVLGADSQYTGAIKRNHAKVWKFQEGDNVVAIAGAGWGLVMPKVKDEIGTKLTAAMAARQIRQMADDVLYPIWVKLLKNSPTPEDDFTTFILAIRTATELTLWESQGSGAFAKIQQHSQCVGCGATLGLYFADWLFDEQLPMAQTRVVATHLIKQAKQYDPNVGGETSILMLPKAVAEAPYFLDQPTITAIEDRLSYTKNAVRALVRGTGLEGVDFNQETADRRRETMDTAASAAGATYIPVTGVTARMFAGDFPAVKVASAQKPDAAEDNPPQPSTPQPNAEEKPVPQPPKRDP